MASAPKRPIEPTDHWGGEVHSTTLDDIRKFSDAMAAMSTPGVFCPHKGNDYDFSRGNMVAPICTVVWNVDDANRCRVCGAEVDVTKQP